MILSQFGLAVAGGACGAALTQAATFLRDWLNKGEEGKFTALTLALSLEDYAERCTEPHFTLDNYVSSKQSTQEPTGSVPSLPEFSDKTNWRSIGVDHASRVLGFRVRVKSAQNRLSDVWQFEGPVSAWGAAADDGIELGAAALDVATRLRAGFRLPERLAQASFDADEWFAEHLADVQKRRAATQLQMAEMFGDHSAATANESDPTV